MIAISPSVDVHLPADSRVEDAAYYRRVLHDMIDVGVALVRQLPEQAQPAGEGMRPDETGLRGVDGGLAYDRLTRAVRRSIMLARAIAESRAVPDGHAMARVGRRKRILREIEDLIHRETSGERAERLHAELLERLDSPELDEEPDERPVEEIITELRRDLGLGALPGTHPWKRRTPEDIDALHARATKAVVLAEAPPAMRGQLVAMLGLGDGDTFRRRAAGDDPDG